MIQTAVMDVRWLEDETQLEMYSSFVSKRCQDKLQRLRPISSRARSLGAELLLWAMLRRQQRTVKWEISESTGGKPYFATAPELKFNLSHSGYFAAGAVAQAAVGVDIQEVRPQKANVAGRYFTEAERTYIAEAEHPEQAFMEVWSLRESYLKKTGEGLALSLNEFSILPGEHFRVCRNGVLQEERLKLWHPEPGYALAVCGQEEIFPLVWRVTEKEVRDLIWNGKS
ncbi:4'-phosphopantetheinyl transferase family protein [Hominifimenecus sp. rT4P-3]|uniref:4'-phosphopantetheinyl transferase family protein n=1 Tax=Hominifimenecus sp. rT4P-3 TaxID=3242979 RepID=UPI003DA1EDFB